MDGEEKCEGGVCKLMVVSKEEASRLGFGGAAGSRKLNDPIPLKIPPVCTLLPNVDSNEDSDEQSSESSGDHDQTHLVDMLTEWTTTQCIECNSSMGGYTFDSFTIPSLCSSQGTEHCQRLICQAEALVEESRDTFWIPIDDNEEESRNDKRDWCDLEKLAIEVYKRHVKAYNLCSGHSAKKGDTQDETTPGAEWWVQVKPVGSSKTPVDLHYDKDEALAEAFCLGSFPTLSTVTYLTGRDTHDSQYKDDEMQRGGMDEAPTVVFPHTYHDDEDQPISAMLLSRPVRGKHIVFDGRLLHGAPGHPALRSSQGGGNEACNDDNESRCPMRVTFLVNIWRTGRPAGVHILPQSIRNRVLSAAIPNEQSMLLEFNKRVVPQYCAPSNLTLAFTDIPMNTRIILPFVSKGATWIGDDSEDEVADVNAGASEDFNGDKSDDEEDELFLQLPYFITPEYMTSGSDTAIFLFPSGNEARLVRSGIEDED
jgi:hypothetical protein